ncbi:hypothetical protein [Microcoleus sp. B9-D4]|uniref:hypothetical protein n=1 Tax=Microcoleus sp. B9-D4 TaxID=2818711 RepID=UPI002FD632E7
MKIVQNPETGEVCIELKNDEVYDIEEHLMALTEFVSKQAVDVFRLTNSYRKIVGRLDSLEIRIMTLTTKEAIALLRGARKELPDSPQTPEEILEAMKAAANNYYYEAIATNCHTFIEFTGLINEYIKICERNFKQRGVDFTKTSVHFPGEPKLDIEGWELDYINDKLRCIFPDLKLVKETGEDDG